MASNDDPPRKRVKFDMEIFREETKESLDLSNPEILSALKGVMELQTQIDSLNSVGSIEILDVERNYSKLRKPHFEKRAESIEKVHNFWFDTLLTHPHFSSIVTENELECLKYLTKIEVEDSEDIVAGYWIKFHFAENPYFENSVLIKEFDMMSGVPISMSTAITWKQGKDLTKSESAHIVEMHEQLSWHTKAPDSFFDWFFDHSDPENDQVAEVIKDELWPNPLEWYNMTKNDDGSESSSDEDDVDKELEIDEGGDGDGNDEEDEGETVDEEEEDEEEGYDSEKTKEKMIELE